MNRAQRRQQMRAEGWRGKKANRARSVPTPMSMATADDDSARRQSARVHGLLVPPSVVEAERIRQSGGDVSWE